MRLVAAAVLGPALVTALVAALATALLTADALMPISAQALTAAPAKNHAANAVYYGDPGTGRASRTHSPYITAV